MVELSINYSIYYFLNIYLYIFIYDCRVIKINFECVYKYKNVLETSCRLTWRSMGPST